MSTNKDITLYLDNRNPPPVVNVSQGDTDWLYRFTVMYNNAVYSPSVTYVILTGHKPDGHVFAYRGAKSGNLYTVTPANANGNLVQMTAVAGDVPCELRLISGGRSVGTANFILRVEPGPEGVVTVASASALPAYTTILQELGVLIGKVESLPDDVPGWIGDWLEEHISGGQGVAVDNTLTVQGAAADAKATGDRLTALEGGKLSIDGSDELTDAQKATIRTAIGAEAVGQGLSDDVKNALLACFRAVAWDVPNKGSVYGDLLAALFGVRSWYYPFDNSLASAGTKDFGFSGRQEYITGVNGKGYYHHVATEGTASTDPGTIFANRISGTDAPDLSGDFTIAFWAKTTTAKKGALLYTNKTKAGTTSSIITPTLTAQDWTLNANAASIGNYNYGFRLSYISDKLYVQMYHTDYSVVSAILTLPSSVDTTAWHHYAMTRKSGVWRFFFDGVEICRANTNKAFVFTGQITLGAQFSTDDFDLENIIKVAYSQAFDDFLVLESCKWDSNFDPATIEY